MGSNKMPKILYYRESAIQSVISDTWSFVVLGGVFALNHFYMGNNGAVYFILTILWLFYLVGKASSKRVAFTDKEELRNYLNETLFTEKDKKL
jgi:hypothetical protein